MAYDDSQDLILSPLSLDISLSDTVPQEFSCHTESVRISSPHGQLEVIREGITSCHAPAIITFHDLGLNHITNYKKLFESQSMGLVLSHFTIYHVNAPGQEPGAAPMMDDLMYPSIEELSESVEYICHHFGIVSFVGIGSGLGSNVLIRLGKRRPKLIEGLILFNGDNKSAGLMEWGKNVVNIKYLTKAPSIPPSVVEFLIQYHLGSSASERCPRLTESYRQYFQNHLQPNNLLKILQSYNNRNTVKLARDIAANGKTILGANRSLKMTCLNMVGEYSPHLDETVGFNGRLDPEKCTWMKLNDASMIVVEQTEKVSQAIILFLQGLGYTLRKPISSKN